MIKFLLTFQMQFSHTRFSTLWPFFILAFSSQHSTRDPCRPEARRASSPGTRASSCLRTP